MLTSVAVLSDVHGVLPALDAVLAEPEVRAADLIVLTGDHAAGPQPRQVLDRMLGLGERAVMVRGNADRELAALARGGALDLDDPVSTWAAAQLGPGHVELLEGLPHPVTLPVRGFGRVLFCHGSPRDDEEVLLVDTRMQRWQEAFAACARTSGRSCAGTPTCRSCAWSTGGSSSTPAAWACRTAAQGPTGRCCATGL